MALINKHFEEVLGDIGVIKLWTTKFLGIPIYRKESLSERMTEISAFQGNPRNAIGFKIEEEKTDEAENQGENSEREVSSRSNRQRRLDRFKGKRRPLFKWTFGT